MLTNALTQTDKRTSGYRYYVLAILILCMVMSWTDRQVFAIVLQKIKLDLHLGDTELGLVGGLAFGIFYATLGLPVAYLADRIGRRVVMAVSIALWSVATCGCGLATNFTSLFFARVSVGVGEAGGSPAAQALVSDYFGSATRGRALGILFLHVPIGYAISFALGGRISDVFGWKHTFVIFGLPGIFLALLVALTIREPFGNQPRTRTVDGGVRESAFKLLESRSLRHIIIGGTVFAIGTFGASVWLPSFYMRTHALTATSVGTDLAIVVGITGFVGAISGGALADRLVTVTKSSRWLAHLPMVWILITIPTCLGTLLFQSILPSLLSYGAQSLANQLLLAPLVASIQEIVGPKRRAQGAALYLLAVNLVAASLGPFIIGFCSQHVTAGAGADSLRYALLLVLPTTALWASIHFLIAGRSISSEPAHQELSGELTTAQA